MQDEIASIHKNSTWELIPLALGKTILSTKWVYKSKINHDGSLNRCKARLIARGFEQQPGIDFDEIFALVVEWSTIRAMVA